MVPVRRPSTGKARVACALVPFATFACATGHPRISFDEAGFAPEDLSEVPPPPLVRAGSVVSAEPEVVDGEEARRIDAALMTFAARERLLRASRASKAVFTTEAGQAWTALFSEVDAFLASDASHTPALELTRTYVTLDAELGLDEQTYASVPPDVVGGSRGRQQAVRARMSVVQRLPVRRKATLIVWPISPPLITSLYGYRVDPITGEWENHLGVDIAAQQGQLITAAAPGVISRAQWQGGHGLHVEIDHSRGLVTRYSHLSVVLTTPGARVKRGDPIGLAGSSGRSTGPHLHFEIWRDGRPMDPLALLREPDTNLVAAAAPTRSARRAPRRKRAGTDDRPGRVAAAEVH